MTPAELAEIDRRRAVLSTLFFAPGYRLPQRAVRDQVEQIGYTASMDRIRTDCAWLAEQGLISLEGEVATLSARGEDVVMGRTQTPGVRRPAPGEI